MTNFRRYNLTMMFLSLLSILLIILDLLSVISILDQPYFAMDTIFVVIFTLDYIYRLVLYEDKKEFIQHHVFDLLSIIPFYSIFRLFRLSRVLRILRFTHLVRFSRFSRLIGLKMRSQREIKTLLQTNGLMYALYASLLLILFGATLFTVAESIPFSESVWWALVTASTVGHAEIYPVTLTGRFAATILMFLGLAMIGVLTSSLTSYFNQAKPQDSQKMADLEQKVDKLLEKISELEDKLSD